MSGDQVILFGITLDQLVSLGLQVIGAIAILIAGWIVSSWGARIVRKSLDRSPRFDRTIGLVFAQVTRWAVLLLTLVAVLQQFGVPIASFVAVLGAAGLAIGLALQGALSNVASGVMLLGLRPFKVGDAVEIAGTVGLVDEIGLLTTKLHTFDNIGIHIPNSSIWGQPIKNLSEFDTRRLEMTFGISYSDDIGKAITLIQGIIEADERVLKEPAVRIGVTNLGDSSVDLLVWVWVKRVQLLDLRLDMTRKVKETFDAEGISIPFPQRDVHLFHQSTTSQAN
jgi:small conductance mechanosensitive channel